MCRTRHKRAACDDCIAATSKARHGSVQGAVVVVESKVQAVTKAESKGNGALGQPLWEITRSKLDFLDNILIDLLHGLHLVTFKGLFYCFGSYLSLNVIAE
jgi:hypothetical protein